MADGVEVSRSIQFVSLDTHPANNALVVTYEILVSIIDGASRRELSRRNKRAQLQIHIKEFDQLEEKDFRTSKIDVARIRSEIIKKCPLLLSSSSQNLENIQLHLSYLLNRRQASLSSGRNPELSQHRSRPLSSASTARSGSSRSGRLQGSGGGRLTSDDEDDIYAYVRALEARGEACCFEVARVEEQLNRYLDSIEANSNLASCIASKMNIDPSMDSNNINGKLLDGYLEGLYGNRAERFVSLAILRRICYGSEQQQMKKGPDLLDISSNRLLICALIRSLRDSSVDQEYCAHLFILSCLMKLTSYEDIYLEAFEDHDVADKNAISIDLVKVLCDLLADFVKNSTNVPTSIPQQEPPQPTTVLIISGTNTTISYYQNYLSAILVLFINLFKIRKNNSIESGKANNKLGERIFSSNSFQESSRLGLILSELFTINAKDLMREIKLMGKLIDKFIQQLEANIVLMRQLSCNRGFIQSIRNKNQFFESIVTLLNCLQLSRPGSGNPISSAASELSIKDKQTLNELYHLELNLLMFVNNLLLDSRIRTKFIKKKLLKPALRNLVIFLATTTTKQANHPGNNTQLTLMADINNNYMDSCGSSLILMVPFRSLYELSCDISVRLELYKSRIIMKCLLEYLLSSAGQQEFTSRINESLLITNAASSSSSSTTSDWMDGSISIVEPTNVCHYILGVWINLSSLKGAPIYDDEELELKDLISEYVDLALDKLKRSLMTIDSSNEHNHSTIMMNQEDYNLIYLHLKLLRNLSQYMRFNQEEELEFYARCLDRLSELGDRLFDLLSVSRRRQQQKRQQTNWILWNLNLKPYSIECLASLSNLIAARPINYYNNSNSMPIDDSEHKPEELSAYQENKKGELPACLSSIFGKLFQLKCEHFDDNEEYDDLLLVSIQLVGFLANKLEICGLLNKQQASGGLVATINQEDPTSCQQVEQQQRISVKILRACNFILSSKLADQEILINTLYSLGQLMNHSQFLKSLLLVQEDDDDDDDGVSKQHAARGLKLINGDHLKQQESSSSSSSNLSQFAELLVDKLANLVLHTGETTTTQQRTAAGGDGGSSSQQEEKPTSGQAVPRLALELLNLFRQLEQQTSIESSIVHKIRFANYNTKWLAAIQASREALESSPPPPPPASSLAATTRVARDKVVASANDDDGDAVSSWFGSGAATEEDGLLFGQQTEDDEDDSSTDGADTAAAAAAGYYSSSSKRLPTGASQQLHLQPMMEEEEEDDDDEQADGDFSSSDSAASSSFGEAPDLNVIDPNSMIKHLSSRRQLRQMRN